MPTKLDFNIGKVSNDNDALFTWAVDDIATATKSIWEKAMSTVFPSLITAAENTAQLVRKPINTTFSKSNWKKLLLTLPAVGSDVVMKSLRLPFATLNDALIYVVNNNLERGVDFSKAYTTRLAANIISNKWQSRFGLLKWLWTWVEGFGDLIGSVIKTPTWVLGKWTSIINEVLAKWTTKTDGWVNGLRVSDTNFIPRNHYDGVTNSSSMPEVANDNIMPAANDNSVKTSKAA